MFFVILLVVGVSFVRRAVLALSIHQDHTHSQSNAEQEGIEKEPEIRVRNEDTQLTVPAIDRICNLCEARIVAGW